jgi:hypothetical protein
MELDIGVPNAGAVNFVNVVQTSDISIKVTTVQYHLPFFGLSDIGVPNASVVLVMPLYYTINVSDSPDKFHIVIMPHTMWMIINPLITHLCLSYNTGGFSQRAVGAG